MAELSTRQIKILTDVIEEYIDTAKPVGSETLDRKFNLGVSPATLRNEMAFLTEEGFLKQPHTSAGRVPTPKALRYYVNNLMKTKDLSLTDEVKIKERVWDYRKEFEKVLKEATHELAERTKSLAVASDSNGGAYYSGTANILDMPEFFDIDLTRSVLTLMDHFDNLNRIFNHEFEDSSINVLLADELGYSPLSTCAVVYTKFGSAGKPQGYIGVIGPCRLDYPRLVPTVRYFGDLMNEMLQ